MSLLYSDPDGTSPLCRSLVDSPVRAWSACLWALLIVGTDMYIAKIDEDQHYRHLRLLCALVGLLVLLHIAKGNLESIGLTLAPAPSWSAWRKITLAMGGGLVVLLSLATTVQLLIGESLRRKAMLYSVEPELIPEAFVRMVVVAPIFEEVLYRLVLCVGVAAVLGPRIAIVASGLIFALLHVLYGNSDLVNQVGGFLLAWAFFHSRSIYVPMALHALGNSGALLGQIVAHYVGPHLP